MRTTLVTGINGWMGGHLAASLLQDPNVRVVGIGRRPALAASLRSFADRISYHVCDVTGPPEPLACLLAMEGVDGIIHLAGLTVSEDWSALFRANVLGTVNLLSAVLGLRQAGQGDPSVLVVSSSTVYGQPATRHSTISEECPLCPLTPYGVSKVAQELAAYRFFLVEGMRIVRVRTFNPVGPGQPPHLVCSSIARQIARAEARGEPAHVRVGRLDTERDFVDVRDAVSLCSKILWGGSPGDVYNCGSGVAHSVEQVAKILRSLASVEVKFEQATGLMRRVDVRFQQADLARVSAAMDWRPCTPLVNSLGDLLEEWRRRIACDEKPE